MKTTKAKKTAAPIPTPGSKSVDPLSQTKNAIETKLAAASDH